MHGAGRELLGDLGGRQERDLDAVEPRDGAAIVAHAARLDQFEPGAGEEALGVFLQPALGGHRENERRSWAPHDALPRAPAPSAASRSIHTARPTAGTGRALPSRVSSAS